MPLEKTDHFAALGLPRDASDTDIRAAYRLLARRYHPDMGGGYPIEAFLAVKEAWEVLRDADARKQHRLSLGQGHGSGPGEPVRAQRPAPRGVDPADSDAMDRLVIDVRVDRDTARHGGGVTVRLPIDTACPECADHGLQRGACGVCNGGGRLRMLVRATLEVPAGVADGGRTPVRGQMELFGPFTARARVIHG